MGEGLSNPGYDVAVSPNGNIYVCGSFASAGGNSAKNIAKWDGSNWSPLDIGLNSACSAITIDNKGTLYAGGWFSMAGEVDANRIARWEDVNVSVANVDQPVKLIIYPNPTTGKIIISGIEFNNSTLNIRGHSGKLLKSQTLTEEEFDVSDLPAGTYLLSIYNDTQIFSTKFVKN